MGGGVSPWLVAVLLVVCAVGAASQVMTNNFRSHSSVEPDDAIELVVHEVARCANGQAVLVLREKGGERRLPMPIGAAEAAALDRRVHGEKSDRPRVHDLAGQSIAALGGRVTAAYIATQTSDKIFLGHVTLAASGGEVRLPSRAADSVALALDAGAPILIARELFERTGVDPGDLRRGQNAQKARTSRNAPPAPVHRI